MSVYKEHKTAVFGLRPFVKGLKVISVDWKTNDGGGGGSKRGETTVLATTVPTFLGVI